MNLLYEWACVKQHFSLPSLAPLSLAISSFNGFTSDLESGVLLSGGLGSPLGAGMAPSGFLPDNTKHKTYHTVGSLIVFLYCSQIAHCLVHLNSIGWATCATWTAKRNTHSNASRVITIFLNVEQ